MSNQDVILYHFGEAVCAQKTRLFLAEKGVEWESRIVALNKGEQFSDEYLNLNPKAVVPTLIHDGNVITESTVVGEYIDDAFNGVALKPDNAYECAQMRILTKKIDEFVHVPNTPAVSFAIALRYLFLEQLDTPEKLEAHLAKIPNKASRYVQREGITKGLDSEPFNESLLFFQSLCIELNERLSKTEWLAADTFSLADIGYAPYIHRLNTMCLDFLWEECPFLSKWYEKMQFRPSWKMAITDWQDPAHYKQMNEAGQAAKPKVLQLLEQNQTARDVKAF